MITTKIMIIKFKMKGPLVVEMVIRILVKMVVKIVVGHDGDKGRTAIIQETI